MNNSFTKLFQNSLVIISKLFIICFPIIIYSCSSTKGTSASNEAPSFKIQEIDTSTTTTYQEISTTNQSKDVIEIRPRISGYIDRIEKQEGSFVKKGELIFKIADADYVQQLNAAYAGVEQALANLANAKLEVEKLTPLVKKEIISPYELQSAKSKLDAASAALQQAKAQHENAKINLNYTKITAPVDGYLGIIPVRVGSLISSSSQDALTTISGIGDFSAYFSLDEKCILATNRASSNTKSTNKKEGYIELLLADGTLYSQKGILENASGIIDRTTGSIQMKVIFPNPKMEVLSGSSGVLRFPTIHKGAISIPQSACYQVQDKVMAYILTEGNKVESRSLDIVANTETQYIVSNLQRGEKIVIEGVNKLKDGMVITPKIN